MGSYLISTTPAHGHVAPLLTIARHLIARGHRVRFLTGAKYADAVTAAGAEFLPIPPESDIDLDRAGELFPERAGLAGPAAIRFDLRNIVFTSARGQYDALLAAIETEPTDAVLTEGLYLGAALLALRPRTERPPIVALGIFPLGAPSRDTAPFGVGMTPMGGWIGRLRNRVMTTIADKAIFGPVLEEADALAHEIVGRSFGGSFMTWNVRADALVQFTVPSFEYPRSDAPANLRFFGPVSRLAPSSIPLPEWWHEVDGSRPVVHVTQGTVANLDFGELVRPTLDGLAGEDVLVVVSTGGRPVSELGPLPANARAAEMLPYPELMARTDVFVTNGGYGGLHYAFESGVPVVVAGDTEDKPETAARVAWSGTGIDLRTGTPSADAVRDAVRTILADGRYAQASARIGADIQASPGVDGLVELVRSLAPVRS